MPADATTAANAAAAQANLASKPLVVRARACWQRRQLLHLLLPAAAQATLATSLPSAPVKAGSAPAAAAAAGLSATALGRCGKAGSRK